MQDECIELFVVCETCSGNRVVSRQLLDRGEWRVGPCWACHGEGHTARRCVTIAELRKLLADKEEG